MAVPFLYSLPRTALAAYPFILRGTRAGLSSRAIEASIRSAGMQISRTRTILPLMQRIQQLERAASRIRNVPRTKTINVGNLPPAVTTVRKNYSFSVRVEAMTSSGTRITRFVQVGFDNPGMTPADVLSRAEEAINASEDYNIQSVERLVIESGVAAVNPQLTG